MAGKASTAAGPRSTSNNLMKACALGEVASVKRILDNKKVREAQLRRRDNHGWSPLHHAVDSNNVECVRLLLKQHGIDRKAKNHEGQTPLFLASDGESTDIEIIKLLVAGDRLDTTHNDNEGVPLLHQAVHSNRLEILQLFVENQIDVGVKDAEGDTCLHFALFHEVDEAIIDYILSWPDFDAAQENDQGYTPLIIALQDTVEERRLRLIDKLLPRTFATASRPGLYNPSDLLKPAFAALQLRLRCNQDPSDFCDFFLERGGYLDVEQNKMYPLLKFLTAPDAFEGEQYEVFAYKIFFFLQFALHDQVWPNLLKVLELYNSSLSDPNQRFEASIRFDRIVSFLMQCACDSDQHLQFVIEMYRQLGLTDAAQQLRSHDIMCETLKALDGWLENDRSLEHLERASKWLDFYHTKSCRFETMFRMYLIDIYRYSYFEPWSTGNSAVLRMLAPYCLKLQADCFNYDILTHEFLSNVHEEMDIIRRGLIPLMASMPAENVASLKFLSRKAVLRTHNDNDDDDDYAMYGKLDKYCENMAQLDLPEVLKDYLCFKLTKNDYLNLFNS